MEYHEQFVEGADRQLEQLNIHYVRALLNILTEAPFFYRTDDVDVFEYLRSHHDDFQQFFSHYFGWELYADRRMARVIKPREYNQGLRPSQRDLFDLTRRDECSVFLLLVEFYEKLLRDLNISYDDDGAVRFLLADFVQYCVDRFAEELGEPHVLGVALAQPPGVEPGDERGHAHAAFGRGLGGRRRSAKPDGQRPPAGRAKRRHQPHGCWPVQPAGPEAGQQQRCLREWS